MGSYGYVEHRKASGGKDPTRARGAAKGSFWQIDACAKQIFFAEIPIAAPDYWKTLVISGVGVPTAIWHLSELLRAADAFEVQEALDKFECRRDGDVTEFLQQHAIDYENRDICRTFLVLDDSALDDGRILVIAFFTLAMVPTVEQEDDGATGQQSSAFLIAHLARDDRYSTEDYDGTQLLREAEEMIAAASDLVGGQLMYLDCKIDESGTSKLCEYYTQRGYATFSREDGSSKMVKRILK